MEEDSSVSSSSSCSSSSTGSSSTDDHHSDSSYCGYSIVGSATSAKNNNNINIITTNNSSNRTTEDTFSTSITTEATAAICTTVSTRRACWTKGRRQDADADENYSSSNNEGEEGHEKEEKESKPSATLLQQPAVKKQRMNSYQDTTSTDGTTTQHAPDPKSMHIHDLADEIWFLIISFLKEEMPCRSMDLCTVFRILYLVSKKDHARMIRYARHVPQNFRYAQEDLIQLVWACQHQIKIGRADFRMCDNYSDYILCMHMLRTCNTMDLKILKIRTFWLSNDNVSKNKRILKKASKLGLVVSWTPFPAQQQQNVSCQQVQSAMSCLIKEHVPQVKKICIEGKSHELDIPLITHYKQYLEDLTFKIFRCWEEGDHASESESQQQRRQQRQQQQNHPNSIPLDRHLEQVTNVVAFMPNLKKLKINACFSSSFRVRSSSLTKIDVRGCAGGFCITECICPKLKVLRMSYYIPQRLWTGAIPLSKQKVEEDIIQDELKNNGGNSAAIQDFQAQNLPCIGLHVPGDCTIKLFLVH